MVGVNGWIVTGLVAAVLVAGCTDPGELDGAEPATPPPDVPDDDTPPEVPPAGPDDPPPPPDGPAPDQRSGASVESPNAPLVVGIDIDDVEAFFGSGSLVEITYTGSGADRVDAGLVLPSGITLVEGNTSYHGPFTGELVLATTLRAEPGSHILRAWGEVPFGVGSRVAPSVLMGITGPDDIKIFVPDPEPAGFEVALSAAPGEPGDVSWTAGATRVDAEARLEVLVPDAFTLIDGETAWNGTLVTDVPREQALRVGFPDAWAPGYYVLYAYLYPDPAIDGRLYSDELYYWSENGEVVVSEEPPADA